MNRVVIMSWVFSSIIIHFALIELIYLNSAEEIKVPNTRLSNAAYPCPPWYTYRDQSKCSSVSGCRDPSQLPEQLVCDDDEGAQVQVGYCMTYSEQGKTFQFNSCHYFQPKGHSITEQGYVILPDNVSELNDYMCGLMNRRGPLCSRCIDGFGPALTSETFACSNCTNVWYGVPLYLLVEFFPITVFYVIVLTLQISFTSSPMTCYTFYSHLILFPLQYDRDAPLGILIYQFSGVKLTIIKAVYGMTNLEILRFIVPPFCVSSKLQFIHITFLECLTAFYPLLLVLLT